MTLQQTVVTLIAAVISGSLATIITIIINAYHEKMRSRKQLVDDIFGFRYQLIEGSTHGLDINSNGIYRALNRVPIVFANEKKVLYEYKNFIDVISMKDEDEKQRKFDDALINFLKKLCEASHIKCDTWNDSMFKNPFSRG